MGFSRVTVGTAATQIVAANGNRKALLIVNRGTASVFLGDDSSVTATTGFEVEVGQAYEDSTQPTAAIWGIAAAVAQRMDVTEVP